MSFFLTCFFVLASVLIACSHLRAGKTKTTAIYLIGFPLGFLPGLYLVGCGDPLDKTAPGWFELLLPFLCGLATLLIVRTGDMLSSPKHSKADE